MTSPAFFSEKYSNLAFEIIVLVVNAFEVVVFFSYFTSTFEIIHITGRLRTIEFIVFYCTNEANDVWK